jgi:prepilin-type N-terminal cleavage/methylation domain-containing protein
MEGVMSAQRRRGFTLIELLIVVVIIGILAAIAVPKLRVTRDRAYRSSMMADLRSVANAQEIFHLGNYAYATSLAGLEITTSDAVTITVTEADTRGWAATATHAAVDGGQCGVFYGTAAASNAAPATTPGVIACDFGP